MPVYEYRCLKCRRRFSIWWRTFAEATAGRPVCVHCGSEEVTRLISRIRVLRSEDSVMDDLADPSQLGDLDENDPKSLGRFMRKMRSQMGEEAADLGPEFDEVVDRLEAGQNPEEIEKAVPGLMGPEGGEAGGDTDLDF